MQLEHTSRREKTISKRGQGGNYMEELSLSLAFNISVLAELQQGRQTIQMLEQQEQAHKQRNAQEVFEQDQSSLD